MYIHLGNNTIIRQSDIIGIFDLDYSTVSAKTREFLSLSQKNGRVVNVSSELPKSFVVCSEKDGIKIYICQLAPVTLNKRILQADEMYE